MRSESRRRHAARDIAIRRRQTHDNDEYERDACRGPPSVSLLGKLSLSFLSNQLLQLQICDTVAPEVQRGRASSKAGQRQRTEEDLLRLARATTTNTFVGAHACES